MSRKFIFLICAILLVLVGLGSFYFYISKSGTTSSGNKTEEKSLVSPGPKEYEVTEKLLTYVEPDEKTYRGYLIPGKTFQIAEEQGPWARIVVWEPNSQQSWEGWIIATQSAYKLKE